MVSFNYNDGGRKAAGFEGGVNDCVSRAIAIVTGKSYLWVHTKLMSLDPDIEKEGINVFDGSFLRFMDRLGFVWVPRYDTVYALDLPKGKFIIHTPHHYSALVDGVIFDTVGISTNPIRGYWIYSNGSYFSVFCDGTKISSRPMSFNLAKSMAANLSQTRKYRKFFVNAF